MSEPNSAPPQGEASHIVSNYFLHTMRHACFVARTIVGWISSAKEFIRRQIFGEEALRPESWAPLIADVEGLVEKDLQRLEAFSNEGTVRIILVRKFPAIEQVKSYQHQVLYRLRALIAMVPRRQTVDEMLVLSVRTAPNIQPDEWKIRYLERAFPDDANRLLVDLDRQLADFEAEVTEVAGPMPNSQAAEAKESPPAPKSTTDNSSKVADDIDGPFSPGCFRLLGREVRGFGILEWRLIEFLWDFATHRPKESAEMQAAIDYVYGESSEKEDKTFQRVRSLPRT